MTTYAGAGVDVAAGAHLVERIKPAAALTRRAGVVGALGGFGGLFDLGAAGYRDPILVAATDGVGTKLRIAIDTGQLDTVGIDLVAMCVNDLVCQGAEPLFFLDYLAAGKLSVSDAANVIDGITEGCRRAGAALIGGETAEMPGIYAAGDLDLAGFAVGALERGRALPSEVGGGDVLLGLASNGLHSNGFSLVRHVVAEKDLDWSNRAPFAEKTLGAALLTPTRIYVRSALEAIRAGGVRALAHITGGGLTENLPRVLPDGLRARVDIGSWDEPAVFGWLRSAGDIGETEMRKTFNCGIGMVLVVERTRVECLTGILEEAGETVRVIGVVEGGEGVRYA